MSRAEKEYLKTKNPVLYARLAAADLEKKVYERELKRCRTKEEVQRLKLSHTASSLSAVNAGQHSAGVSSEQKMALVNLCKHWQVPVNALGDKEHAVITAGGVDVREVDPKTMASKLCEGLYFAGEVLDVDARTGGYNLQIAWSTEQAAVRAL